MSNHTYKKIGERVKQLRTNRGFSQDELAEGICSRQTISLLENGVHLPSAEFIRKIAEKLGVAIHEILVEETKHLESKVQLDMIKVYVETGAYSDAMPLLHELEKRGDLLEYQRRDLVLHHAECLMRTGEAEDAVRLLTELQEQLELQRVTDDHLMATLHNKLGNAFYYLSNMLYAHSHYMRAHQICLRFPENNLLRAQVYYNLGNVSIWMGNYSEANRYLTEAHAFFTSADEPKKYATTLFSIGLSYHGLQDFENADRYLQESLALFTSLKVADMAHRARQQYASLVLAQQNPKQAIQELMECAEDFKKSGDRVRLAYTYANIASLHLEMDQCREAGTYLQPALSLVQESDHEKDPRCSYVLRTYGKYLLAINNFDQAIDYAIKSSEFFAKMGIEREAADSLQLVAEAQKLSGDVQAAFETMQQVTELLRRSQDKSFMSERRTY